MATSDGGIYNSSRVGIRNITLTLLFYQLFSDKNHYLKPMSIEDLRQQAYKYFNINKKVTIKITTDNRTVVTEGYVESNEPEIFSANEGTVISIICPDPYLYSVDVNETKFSGIEPTFEFPFSNESLTEPLLELGSIKSTNEQLIVYDGEVDVGMTFHIHVTGDVNNITITNMRTDESIGISTDKIVGSKFIAGDNITISTQPGHKYITLLRDGITYNILNSVNRNSKWFVLTKGDNIFAYTADTGSTNLQFYITNRIAYDGV